MTATEISFPLEFTVQGTPVSLQAKRPQSRAGWTERIRAASYAVLPEGHFSTELSVSVTILYFPAGPMRGDIDNIVKPILDALCRHVYHDDGQVERVWVQKFEPGSVLPFRFVSACLANAMTMPRPVVYIQVSDDPAEGSP